MKRRALLGVLSILALGGAALWTFGGGGGRHDGPGRSLLDEPASDDVGSPSRVGDGTGALPEPLDLGALARRDPRPAPVTGSGSVVARIVRASDGAALAGIFVRLEGPSSAGAAVSQRLWSDERGDARFADVPVGVAYALHVQRDPTPPVDRLGIAVRADETTDLGRIKLESVGVVDALVLDVKREPIVGATVSVSFLAEAVREMDDTPWPLAPDLPGAFVTGVTDDRGRVRIEGVAPGPVAVRATSSNYRGRTFRVFVPPEPPKTAFVAFVLDVGGSYGGRVVDAERRPVPGALVEFGFDGVTTFDAKASTRSGDDGTFVLRGTELLRTYDLRVSAEGYATVVVTTTKAVVGDRSERRLAEPTSVEVLLDKSASFTVLVLGAATKEPVPGARVRCAVAPSPRAPGEPVSRTTYEGRSDPAGFATIPFPALAPADLEVVADGHRTLRVSHVPGSLRTVGGEFTGDLLTPATPGETRKVTAFLGTGFPLAGVVTTDAGDRAPISAALVELWHGEQRAFALRTDRLGNFESKDALLPDRSPRLRVSAAGFYPALITANGLPDRDGVSRVSVALHAIERAISITGIVTDAGGRPVEGALVRIPDRELTAFSGPDGSFRFDGVPRRLDPTAPTPPSISVDASKGNARCETAAAVPAPKDGDVVSCPALKLLPVTEIAGVVMVGMSGNRSRFPLVELIDARSKAVLDVLVAGEFGDFRFLDRVADTYRVRARDATRGGGLAVAVRDGVTEPTFPEVRMVDATICAGRIEDRRGKPVAGLPVRLECDDPPPNQGEGSLTERAVFTDVNGEFRFHCFGTRPRTIYGPVRTGVDARDAGHEWWYSVEAGESNVIHLKMSEYQYLKLDWR